MRFRKQVIVWAALLVPLPFCVAQYSDTAQPQVSDRPLGADASAPATSQPAFSKEQIAQLVAPLALYPDSLLTQIFMASTYPLEVVQADRFVKSNPSVQGEDLAKQLEQQRWDPSVKSLVNFPKVLAMMSEQLDTTVQIGNAFLAQQQDVLAAVQDLRQKAQTAGNLKTNEQVNVQPLDNSTGGGAGIAITPTQDDLAYVPNYDPTTIYGAWPYPNYAPISYAPVGYGYGNLVYGSGIVYGAPWGYAFGRCDWNRRWIDYDFDRNSRYNHYIDRNRAREHYEHVFIEHHDQNDRRDDDHWIHDPRHRDGVPYADARDAQRFGDRPRSGDPHTRDDYRGRSDSPTIINNNNAVVRSEGQKNTWTDNNRADNTRNADRNSESARWDDRSITIRRGDAGNDESRNHAHQTGVPEATPRVGPSEIDRSAAEERAAAERGRESRAVSPTPRNKDDSATRGDPQPRSAVPADPTPRGDPQPRAIAPAPRGDPQPRAVAPAAPAPRGDPQPRSVAPAAPAPRVETPSGGRSAAPAPAAPAPRGDSPSSGGREAPAAPAPRGESPSAGRSAPAPAAPSSGGGRRGR